MKGLFCFFLLLMFKFSYGQLKPYAIWQNKIDVRATAAKRSKTIVTQKSDIVFISNTYAGWSYFRLVKFDSTGNEKWNNEYTSISNPYQDLTIDSFENVYVSFEIGKYLPGYDSQGKIARFNGLTGDIDWENTYGTDYYTGDKYITDCAVDSLGRVLFFGSNYDTDVFFDSTYTMFLYCLDAETGAEIWRKEWPGLAQTDNLEVIDSMTIVATSYRYLNGKWQYVLMHLDYDGNVLLEGSNFGIASAGYNRITKTGEVLYSVGVAQNGYAVTKIGLSGDTLWHYQLSNPSGQPAFAESAADDEDGNIYITGTISPDSSALDYIWVTTKLDSNGNMLWQKEYEQLPGAGWTDGGVYVSLDSNTVYTLGYSYSDTFYLVVNGYAKEDGGHLFEAEIPYIIYGDEVFPYLNGFIYTSTYWEGSEATVYIGRFGLPKVSSIISPQKEKTGSVLFPNPSMGLFQISDINTTHYKRIVVANSQGQIIAEKEINTETVQIDLSGLSAGIYFIRLLGEQAKYTHRVVLSGNN